ncbi:MAG TPA: hypothetical protein VNZ27_11295 [Rhodanobacter sp.]|nr:hypothetical protein [Rhodanobacter sp.]
MKRLLASLALITAAAALSGCYYDPGYSYVRGSAYSGDAYYGQGGNAYYVAPNYYDGYYGYYGCCYAPGASIGYYGYYGDSRYRYYRGGGYRGNGGGHDGDHRGRDGGNRQGHQSSGGGGRRGNDRRHDAH